MSATKWVVRVIADDGQFLTCLIATAADYRKAFEYKISLLPKHKADYNQHSIVIGAVL